MLPGKRIYRTGDAACINVDGKLDFKGRIDDQVKIRGYRIELAEIETRLAALPGVAHAAVIVQTDGAGFDKLAAYVLVSGDTVISPDTLRRQLGELLPSYMVPTTITPLDALPRLPSGKVDRKALGILQVPATSQPKEYIDPNAPIAERIIAVLRTMFPGQPISIDRHCIKQACVARPFSFMRKIERNKVPLIRFGLKLVTNQTRRRRFRK